MRIYGRPTPKKTNNKAFDYIIQKVVNKTNKTYDTEYDKTKILEVLSDINKNEFSTVEFDHSDVIRRFYYSYVTQKEQHRPLKFQFLKKTLKNVFMTKAQENIFLDIFSKIQKTYQAFSRMAYIYKFKKATIQINYDLFMNPLTPEQKNVFTLYQNKYKYLFTTTDLINTMLTSLCNSVQFFSDPKSCKNPYNNMYFNKSTLYNIYFFMKFRHFNIPVLLQNYFKANFSLEKFKYKNEALIRDYTIKNHVYTTPNHELFLVILDMFSDYTFNRKNILVDEEFPKDKLVEIMRPYLHLYYKSKYSLESYQRLECMDLLFKKIRKFILFNPCFGRKCCKLVPFGARNKKKCITYFNDSHIPFYRNTEEDPFYNFENSHIEKEDKDYSDEEEKEDDSEDDSEPRPRIQRQPQLQIEPIVQPYLHPLSQSHPHPHPHPHPLQQDQEHYNIIDILFQANQNYMPENNVFLSTNSRLGTYTNYAAALTRNTIHEDTMLFSFDPSMNL